MIKMELEENLKSINQAEVAYLNEISTYSGAYPFTFRQLIRV